MVKWASIPFVRFTLAFTAGIVWVLHTDYPVNYNYAFLFAAASYLLLFILTLRKQWFYQISPFLGFFSLLALFFSGVVWCQLRNEGKHADHFQHSRSEITCYQATVTEPSEEREKSFRTRIEVQKILTDKGWVMATGKVLLYTPKAKEKKLRYGDEILIKGAPQPVQPPSNPYEFDFKKYLAYQQVFHSQFVKHDEWKYLGNHPPSRFIAASLFLREKSDEILHQHISGVNEYKIASALLLGIRSSLDNEIRNAYSSTGTMHVLAVSGMHVALIFGILMALLNFIKLFPGGKVLLPVIIIVCLWMYAFVTGFSASVLRAVLMFSLILVSQMLRRNSNIYNTLAFSAFGLLCYDPYIIMDAGFQLSYMAVLGIVYFHPKIYSLFNFNNSALDRMWLWSSMSVAAQIGTFPLTVYYFHQFPLNFIFSNIIAVPLSGFALHTGLALLVCCWVPGLNMLLGWISEMIIWIMNQAILRVEKIPYSVITGIDIDLPETACFYLMLIISAMFMYYKKLRHLRMFLALAFIFTIIQLKEVIDQKAQHKIIAFSIPGHTAVGIIKGTTITLLADSLLISDKQKQQYHIEPYLIQHGIDEVSFKSLTDMEASRNFYRSDGAFAIIVYHGKKILIHLKPLKNIAPENLFDCIVSPVRRNGEAAHEIHL